MSFSGFSGFCADEYLNPRALTIFIKSVFILIY